MASWRIIDRIEWKSFRFPSLHAIICLIACAFLVSTTTYVAAHDHGEHEYEYGSEECVTCAGACAAQAAPMASSDIASPVVWLKTQWTELRLIAAKEAEENQLSRGNCTKLFFLFPLPPLEEFASV